MRRVLIAALLAGLPGLASAEGQAALRGIGTGPAQPEHLALMQPNGLRIGARIIDKLTGDLAVEAARVDQILRFEAGFLPGDDLPAGTVELRCTLRFVSATGERSTPVQRGVCFDGARAVARGEWVMLDTTLDFRLVPEDPRGTAGVEIHVSDARSPSEVVLLPTYSYPEEAR
jgi:hypothetical protein